MEIYVNIFFDFQIFSFFSFSIMILSYINFANVAASNTANDGDTNYVTHRISNTDLLHSCAHLYLKLVRNVATLTVFSTIS